MTETLQQAAPEWMSLDDIAGMLRLSRTSLERLKAKGELPPHVELSRRAHRWRRADVEEWLEGLAAKAS